MLAQLASSGLDKNEQKMAQVNKMASRKLERRQAKLIK